MAEGLLVFLIFAVGLCLYELGRIERHLRSIQHIERKRFEREVERGDYDRDWRS